MESTPVTASKFIAKGRIPVTVRATPSFTADEAPVLTLRYAPNQGIATVVETTTEVWTFDMEDACWVADDGTFAALATDEALTNLWYTVDPTV